MCLRVALDTAERERDGWRETAVARLEQLKTAVDEHAAARAEVERLKAALTSVAECVDPVFSAWGTQPDTTVLASLRPFFPWTKP